MEWSANKLDHESLSKFLGYLTHFKTIARKENPLLTRTRVIKWIMSSQ